MDVRPAGVAVLLALLVLLAIGVEAFEFADELDTGLCLITPMYSEPLGMGEEAPLQSFGLEYTRALLLAVEHVNNADCAVLGPGCQALLDAGEGRRATLVPYLFNTASLSPEASPPAIKACTATDAQVSVAVFTSAQSTVVASFTGGLGHLLISSASTSPALSRTDLYPNFARTQPNQAENMRALVHFSRHIGWGKTVVMHNQDVLGSQLAEEFTKEGRENSLTVHPISMGNDLSDAEIDGAARQLVETGLKVVVLATFETEISRILKRVKAVIDAAGQSYISYSWVVPTISTQDLLQTSMTSANVVNEDPSAPNLFEGMLGVNVRMPYSERVTMIKEGLKTETADEYLSKIEAYMAAGGSAMGRVSRESFNQTFQELQASEVISSYSLASYDAVWTAAIGVATAARLRSRASTAGGASADTDVTGSEIMQLMESGKFPVFNGSAGHRAFLPNGDWDLSHTVMEVTNYGTPPGATHPRHAAIATIDLGTYGVTMVEGEKAVWANGREYPYVPPDDVPPPSILLMPLVLGSCVAAAVLLSAFLVWRNRRLKSQVERLENRIVGGLDLESPLAKMLVFLRRYQSSRRRPSVSYARDLEHLIVSHAGALTVPDLEKDMGSLSSGIKRFLLSAMKSGAEGVAQAGSVTADSCSSAVDCSARDIEYIKLIGGVRNVPASVVEEGTESVDSPLLIPANLDVGCETNQTLATAAGANIRSAAKDEWIEAPEALKEQIACDFFLDTITSDSPLNFCATPIRLVVQQSMETLRLLPSIPCQSRLLKFTQCVESGYQDDKYHCKKHGADVVHRLMTMLNRTGLAQLSAAPDKKHSQTVGLLSMVAAMVHDYGHPQVSNAFLVELEDVMALDANNQAVAENFALRETMKMVMDPNHSFLAANAAGVLDNSWSTRMQRRKWFRNMVIQMVLATDMSRHFDMLSQFETQIVQNRELRANKSPQELWLAMCDDQRRLVLQIAIKVADLGHLALPMDIHSVWLERLQEEFFDQGDREKAAGLRPSPLMDRDLPGLCAPENQIGFIRVMVLPLFKAWVEVFPACAPLLIQVEANLDHYNVLHHGSRKSMEEAARKSGLSHRGSSWRSPFISRIASFARPATEEG